MIFYTEQASVLGPLLLVCSDEGMRAVYFGEHRHFAGIGSAATTNWQRADAHPLLVQAQQQLSEYFAGQRRDFTLPLAPHGTVFQRAVWQGLREIAYGRTCSYQQLACALGRPTAARAVGAANGRNPLSIIVPCHRVIGGNGELTGYAGGLERKRYLLALEQAMAPPLHMAAATSVAAATHATAPAAA